MSATSVFSSQKMVNIRKRRMFKDAAAKWLVTIGGSLVIVSLLLIFIYLFSVVMPMFEGASVEEKQSVTLSVNKHATSVIVAEEQNEIALRVAEDGSYEFFSLLDGTSIEKAILAPAAAIYAQPSVTRDIFLTTLDNRVVAVRPVFDVTYPDNMRLITPSLEFPLGEEGIALRDGISKVNRLAGFIGEEQGLVVLKSAEALHFLELLKEESLFADEASWEYESSQLAFPEPLQNILMTSDMKAAFAVTGSGEIVYIDLRDKSSPTVIDRIRIDAGVVKATMLAGGVSLLVANGDGLLQQMFLVKNEAGQPHLEVIRTFETDVGYIQDVVPESARRGFWVLGKSGKAELRHATSGSSLFEQDFGEGVVALSIPPRANGVITHYADGKTTFWHVENEHPEISWNSLWGKVWYEGYEQPEYIWQSSAANNDFEPKFSLVPISFGTIKAAFYAMLVATPLAVLGAIYAAYFMSPGMRKIVKPTVEIMEALPTVILGFLAGLWLAPFIEKNLPGFLLLPFTVPFGILLTAYIWSKLPESFTSRVPDGWQGLLLIPTIILFGCFTIGISPVLENIFFGGDAPTYMSSSLGISFDQRNSLVVGLAMGFAVIPTIFSIAEDAIFAVPKSLTSGSLALGATPWQTLTRVVILNALPGIFSAIMMGLGRAVGETMIVLMATGNTAVMDLSIFQGMRTLSANIAVEMPESEVGSTHYRVLFLAALVLFVFTFVFNTFAEVVRTRLRKKYTTQ